jgi:hypothetical protein
MFDHNHVDCGRFIVAADKISKKEAAFGLIVEGRVPSRTDLIRDIRERMLQ